MQNFQFSISNDWIVTFKYYLSIISTKDVFIWNSETQTNLSFRWCSESKLILFTKHFKSTFSDNSGMLEVNSRIILIFLHFSLHIYINLFLVGLSRDVVGVDHVGLHSTSWLWNIDHVGLTLIADTTLPLAQHPINNKNKQRALFSLLTKADKYKQPISSAAASQWQQPRTKLFTKCQPSTIFTSTCTTLL